MTKLLKTEEEAHPMSPARRELMLRILDNETDIHPITMRLHFLDNHFPPEKLDGALKWLVANNLIGKRFTAWYTFVCKGSDLELHRLLLAVLANAQLAPVMAGKNFRL